ncbi:3-oxoadipyl-CoA thiolase [Pseudaestuariivita atlantica]|uniref:Beta-ketoadipyl-CoA thiolase n=1 Tax=Pseudaestuariivita atlantica TaxID=1317121 RepID=A0A0L1JL68_9RHOB|nr:3-oxoadipyl-CoA thiolase [Pseudaestuariivita atlantica]KNG92494.1 beta-ketoadipyl CoA thiolase [Pseudaestuariivita atlantica]
MKEVFICDYVRTPIGRYGGALSGMRADDLAAHPIRVLMARAAGLDPAEVDQVVWGAANQAGEDNRNVARMAALLAGLPPEVPGVTVNRLCASGLDAVIAGARQVQVGEADLVIAGGSESMSRAPFVMAKATAAFDRRAEVFDTTIGWRFVNRAMAKAYGTDAMPETAENVAADWSVARADQDAFALASQERCAAAQASGRLAEEIAPVSLAQRKGPPVEVSQDEHPRATTLEKLASLPTPFREGGSVTAGNASGVNDGAAALVLASEAAVKRHGLTPLARYGGAASAGVAPRVMGIGPVPAVRKLCAQTGLSVDAFDRIELNEAFAAQAIAVCRDLGLDPVAPHLNPNGGAIALGHPLGMTGARLAGTAAHDIGKGRATAALVTLCVGVGQGVAMALHRP